MLEQIEDLEMMNIIHQNNRRVQNSRVVRNKEKYLYPKEIEYKENPILATTVIGTFYILFILILLCFLGII